MNGEDILNIKINSESLVDNYDKNWDKLALDLARFFKSELKELTHKKKALKIIRKWVDFARTENIDSSDHFMVAESIKRFAQKEFSGNKEDSLEKNASKKDAQSIEEKTTETENLKIDESLESSKESAESVLEKFFTIDVSRIKNFEIIENEVEDIGGKGIFEEDDVVVLGGVSRAAMKLALSEQRQMKEKFLEKEFPINDLDIAVIGDSARAKEISQKYGIDLAGIKLFKSIEDVENEYIKKIDISINGSFLYQKKIYFDMDTYEHMKKGLVVVSTAEDPLFAPNAVEHRNKEYILPVGFYRSLIMIIRERANEIQVSKENLEAEKEKIGSYWLTMLFVKILNTENREQKNKYIANWHQLAKKIGSTKTESPEDFLKELHEKYPEISYFKKGEFGNEKQVLWMLKKLIYKSLSEILNSGNKKKVKLPRSYSKGNLSLDNFSQKPQGRTRGRLYKKHNQSKGPSNKIENFDLESFERALEEIVGE